jgi:imidazole glycerol-phosphate synthase subunit HisF
MGNSISNLKKRIIPIILVKDYQVVKSRKFGDYRVFGNLEQTINVFNNRNVDEIIILDIDASKKKQSINLEILNILSKNNIMPLSYGGGISSIEDIELCLKHGCDKIVLNTKALQNIEFVKKASDIFGSQCITCSIDYKVTNNDLKIFSHSGLNTDRIEFLNYIELLIENGAGELIFTSVDREGEMKGFDENIFNIVVKNLDVPFLINGGCGEPKDILNVFKKSKIVDAVCASSIFFYSQYGYSDIKNFLFENHINVRKE